MHHGYNSRRHPSIGISGRQQSIFDGQLRSRSKESSMHYYYGAGNSERSMRVQEENNWLLFKGLQLDYLLDRELPFGSEVQRLIPRWLESFPVWLEEFSLVRKQKEQSKTIIFRLRGMMRSRHPGTYLKKRSLKKRWREEYQNQFFGTTFSAVA